MHNEELIETLRQSHPDSDKSGDISKEPFAISKSTKNTCIDFLNDNDVDISSWISEADENERVKKVLKLWFTICKQFNHESWCAFPTILDNDTFYANAKIILLTEA